MLKGEVGENERACGLHRFGLADDIPVGCQPSKIPGEPLLDAAVKPARLGGREDGVAGSELQIQAATLEDATGTDAEALAPCTQRQELTQRATVDQRAAKQGERSGDLEDDVFGTVASSDGADETAKLRVADERDSSSSGSDTRNVAATAERTAERSWPTAAAVKTAARARDGGTAERR